MRCSLDTNVVLRFLLGDVPLQEEAANQIIKNPKNSLGIADVVFVELEYALRLHYGYTRDQVADIFAALIVPQNVNCNRSLVTRALPKYREQVVLSFVDICLDVYADLTDHQPLYTFDKNLAKKLPHSELLL